MGFQQQLRLWEAMGCRLDPDNAAYRRYMLVITGRRWAEDGAVDPATLPMPTDADADQVSGVGVGVRIRGQGQGYGKG